MYLRFHGPLWTNLYLAAVVVLCAIIVFENPSTMWRYLVPHDEPLLHIPMGALREDGTTGASVPVAQALSMNVLEIGLCCLFAYDYRMRLIIFRAGQRQNYYKYTKKERKTKDRKVCCESVVCVCVCVCACVAHLRGVHRCVH